MQTFRADLHLHTVLSPCGDVSMSPAAIVAIALERGLSLIGITDHNSTRQCSIVSEIARDTGLCVLCGVELTTREEVHLLAWFESLEVAVAFQGWIDMHLQFVTNNPDFFGHQVVVDMNEQVVYEEEKLLIAALDTDIHQTAEAVKAFGGILAAAHVTKKKNSLFSQLGVMPQSLKLDALEVSAPKEVRSVIKGISLPLICGSDAHDADDIGKPSTLFTMEAPTFHEVRLALSGVGGRMVSL